MLKSKSKAHRNILLLIPEHNIVSSESEKKSIIKLAYKYAQEDIIPQLIDILDEYAHDLWVVIKSTTGHDNNDNDKKKKTIDDFSYKDLHVIGYHPHEKISMKMAV